MYFLVRRLTGRGGSEALETDYEGNALTLGTESMVQLPGVEGALQLDPAGDGGAKLSSRKARVTMDGKEVRSAKLAVGDVFELPGYTLQLIQPPGGFDLALQVTAEGGKRPVDHGRLQLAESAWSIRKVSWVLAILVFIGFLLIPALGLFQHDLADTLRKSPLPDDGLWISGPLVSAHTTAGVGEDCQACHTKPFVMVQDQACMECHRDIREHADLEIHDRASFTDIRCATCHREHNEPQQLVNRDKGLCVDCHADPSEWQAPGASGMEAAHVFTAEGHPEFRVALLRPQGPGAAHGWEVDRVRRGSGPLAEQSNLKFNHQVHLNPEKVQDEASGEALHCASCHTALDDGEHFEPVTMDNHCRSCHGLSFDIFEPDLELPHGDLRAAIVAMEAHFIREFTDPVLRKERAGQKPRRVPGKRQAAASCQGNGLDCGRAEAMKEAEYQFVETGCITCHEVLDTGLEDIFDRWFVQPVNVTGDWYPFSRFNHTAHLALAREAEGEICEVCHTASMSEVASDVLIPGQDNCLGCHDDKKGDSAVDCVGCHAFHLDTGTLSVQARNPHGAFKAAGAMRGE